MAVVNSVVVGKGRASVGQVTLYHRGWKTIMRQRVRTNSSNSARQAAQRAVFKRVADLQVPLRTLAQSAYRSILTESYWSRLQRYTFKGIAAMGEQAGAARFGALADAALGSGGNFPMSDGRCKFASITPIRDNDKPFLQCISYSRFPKGVMPLEGERVEVEVELYQSAVSSPTISLSVPLTKGAIVPVAGVYHFQNWWGVMIELPAMEVELTRENILKYQWPVIRVQGERIGYDARTYFGAL